MQTDGSLSFDGSQFALIAKGALLAHTLNIFHKQDVYKEVQAEIKPTYVAKVLSCLSNFLTIKQVDCKFPFCVTKLNILCSSKLPRKGKAESDNHAFHVTKTLDPSKDQGQGNA